MPDLIDSEYLFTPETELRHLRPCDRRHLCSLLDIRDLWKELASVLPKPDDKSGFLFTSSNIDILDQQKYINKSPTKALLDYWGTVGRKRPTIKDLLNYLIHCKLFFAADYVSTKILNGPSVIPTESSLSNLYQDPTLKDISPLRATSPIHSFNLENDECDSKLTNILQANKSIASYPYWELSKSCLNFIDRSISDGGYKIGEGAFGAVFLASVDGSKLAVKILKKEFNKQFVHELEILTQFKHENLLQLLGVSFDGPSLCLVYEYMRNGSLLDRLSCVNNTKPINWKDRIRIAVGSAKGINHLHLSSMVHRDIKSANILLDAYFVPKVGDFGLSRIGSSGATTKAMTSNVVGTSLYMAPEAFRGDVSIKMDSFSFGVVLLELITGQPPYDEKRDGADILSWSQEAIDDDVTEETIGQFLDKRAGDWDVKKGLIMFEVSRLATEEKKKDRPTVNQMLISLEKLLL